MMGCAEQQYNNIHNSHQLYLSNKIKSIQNINIPPRKLLSRRSAPLSPSSPVMDSAIADGAVFSKFLPYNNDDDDQDSDPYSSDHFRMYEFKVRKCNRSRSHDWTDCPFAHPGEKARRRDPRRYLYSGTVCAEFRKGHCSKGDHCEFSHGVFECWLHPSRYRTEACKDGKNCKRKVCFFAHSARQLRIPTEGKNPNLKHCCVCCHCKSTTASPTSTLTAVSRVSPPASPESSSYCNSPGVSYNNAILAQLMSNLEAMNMNHESIPCQAPSRNVNLPWLDINFNAEEQTQFVMSPSTPVPSPGRGHTLFFARDSKLVQVDIPIPGRNSMDEIGYQNESNMAGPDLGWVNDLLT